MMNRDGSIPSIWNRVAAMEVNASTVAILWAAYDRAAETFYLYDAVVLPRTELAVHAEAIRKRGDRSDCFEY